MFCWSHNYLIDFDVLIYDFYLKHWFHIVPSIFYVLMCTLKLLLKVIIPPVYIGYEERKRQRTVNLTDLSNSDCGSLILAVAKRKRCLDFVLTASFDRRNDNRHQTLFQCSLQNNVTTMSINGCSEVCTIPFLGLCLQIYPDEGHFLHSDGAQQHLSQSLVNFFEECFRVPEILTDDQQEEDEDDS